MGKRRLGTPLASLVLRLSLRSFEEFRAVPEVGEIGRFGEYSAFVLLPSPSICFGLLHFHLQLNNSLLNRGLPLHSFQFLLPPAERNKIDMLGTVSSLQGQHRH